MDNRFYKNSNNSLPESNKKNVLKRIESKSNDIKARLKSKYLLYKLQRDFFHRKFYVLKTAP